MSRFFIVNTADRGEARSPRGVLTDGDGAGQCTGCAWLFTAASGVDDAESALRAAVLDHFRSDAGRRLREAEALASLTWEEAIPWVPDEVWERHGLTPLRHPEVERVLLDGEEDLGEELGPGEARTVRAAAAAPLPGA